MSASFQNPTTPTKRTTRFSSSCLTPPPKTQVENPPIEAPITLQTLLSTLPGRRSQILDTIRLIGPANTPMLPLLLYGATSTGKTATIFHIFKHLNRPFVYVCCRSCYSPRILFESVLDQLLCRRKCERASEFVSLLKDAVGRRKEMGGGEMVYLVFDNVEVVRSWEKKSSDVLSVLFRIGDVLGVTEVGLVYVSSSTPDAYYLNTGCMEPVTVYFPDYSVDELQSIFMRGHANPKLYSSFLSVVLKPFYRVTRRVDELSIAFKPLFQKYCEPLSDLSLVPDEATKRRLFDNLQPHLTAALNETFKVPSWSFEADKDGAGDRKWKSRKIVSREATNELDFHMSMSVKYLLLSSFLASRNPATLDAALFDSTGGSDNWRRKRKSSQTSIDQKENLAQEMLMKGPGSFPLERLLAIFQCVTSVAEDASEEKPLEEERSSSEYEKIGLMSDVLLQLSTLCNANLVCKGGSCALEGSTRYRSAVDEEMALKVARSVGFPLSKYLYRR